MVFFHRLPLFLKISSTFFVILLVSITAITLFSMQEARKTHEIFKNTFIQTNLTARTSFIIEDLFSENYWGLYSYLKSISNNAFITEIALTDPQHHIIVHTDSKTYKRGDSYPKERINSALWVPIGSKERPLAFLYVHENVDTIALQQWMVLVKSLLIFLVAIFVSLLGGVFIAKRILERIKLILENTDGPLPSFKEEDELSDIVKRYFELKENYRLAESFSMAGEFAASTSHQFKNILAPIKLLLSDSHTLDQEDLRMLRRLFDKMDRLVLSFLHFAKPSTMEQKEEVHVASLVQETVSLLENSIQKKALSVVTTVEKTCTLFITPKALEYLFFNLLLNAIDASPHGGGIRIAAYTQEGRFYGVVEDEGEGIDPKLFSTVFKPFFTTKQGGTGLGLSIVYKIIQSHHGEITTERIQAKTRFTFWLPLPKESP